MGANVTASARRSPSISAINGKVWEVSIGEGTTVHDVRPRFFTMIEETVSSSRAARHGLLDHREKPRAHIVYRRPLTDRYFPYLSIDGGYGWRPARRRGDVRAHRTCRR